MSLEFLERVLTGEQAGEQICQMLRLTSASVKDKLACFMAESPIHGNLKTVTKHNVRFMHKITMFVLKVYK